MDDEFTQFDARPASGKRARIRRDDDDRPSQRMRAARPAPSDDVDPAGDAYGRYDDDAYGAADRYDPYSADEADDSSSRALVPSERIAPQRLPTRQLAPSMPLLYYSRHVSAVKAPPKPSRLDILLEIERPFPRWLTVLIGVGAAAVVGLAYALSATLGHADWGDMTRTASVCALALFGVSLLIWLGRLALGRRARSTVTLGALLVGALLAQGAGGLALVPTIHAVQGHVYEGQRQWSGAALEYSRSGERGPKAPDVARVQVEWGEQLQGQKSYAGAASHFTIVVTTLAQSGAVVTRASDDLYATYKAWLATGDKALPFEAAIPFLAQYRTAKTCSAACKSEAQTLEAQTRFLYGQALADAKSYREAAEQFEVIQSQFGQTPYAAQAHKAAAAAYLAKGKQDRTQVCTLALPSYQKLAKDYGDTPEGQEAASALSASVDVRGVLQGFPHDPLPKMHLSKQINPLSFFYTEDYSADVDANSGEFIFHGVQQGDFFLNASRDVNGNTNYAYWHPQSDSQAFYQWHVNPLCTNNMGGFAWPS